MADRIITAKDYARREGFKSVRDRILKKSKRAKMEPAARNELSTGKPMVAEINWGQWIVKCECGGAEAVDPDDPVFYCMCCGNHRQAGKLRRVIFPENRLEIEAELLKRPVRLSTGNDEMTRIVYAIPLKYPRVWLPDESLEDLKAQNKEVWI